MLKAVNVLYVYVQIKRTNQSCSPSKISHQSLLHGTLVMEMVNNSLVKAGQLWSFDKAEKVLIEKNKDMKTYFH